MDITTAVLCSEALVLGAQRRHLLWLSQFKVSTRGSGIMVEAGGERRELKMSFTGDGKITEGLSSRLLADAPVGLQEEQHLSSAFSSPSA